MVSSSTVNGDASLINDVFSNYSTGTKAIDNNNVWKGKSKDNAVEQMNNFVEQFDEPISTQMSEFSSALDKYEEWKKKKEQVEEIDKELAKAHTEEAANIDFDGLRAKKRVLNEEIDALAKEIKTSLSTVRSKKLNVTTTDLSTSGSSLALGEFVNYYQGDYQQSYGYGKTIAQAGCGPTSMAMVLTYLTGETHDPVEMANWSLNNGHRIKNNGTAWTYFPAVSTAYGIECEQESVTKNNIINSLNDGKQIILNVGAGHFTKGGHYIVLKGLTEDGKVEVADPASRERSSQTWDISILTSEGKGMWTFDTDKTLGMEI